MKRRYFLVVMGLFCWLVANAQMKTERTMLPGVFVTVMLPRGFSVMPDEVVKYKYPSENRPQIVYGNQDGTISFGFSPGKKPLPAARLDDFKDMFVKFIRNYRPEVEAVTVDGNKGWLLTFTSQAADSDLLNQLLLMSHEEKLVMAAFNMTVKHQAEYKMLGREALLSLQFSATK